MPCSVTTLSFSRIFDLFCNMNYSPSLYEKNFNSKSYAEFYVTEDVKYPLKGYPEEFLHRMFSERRIKGKDLLDFGCGPTVRCAISASAHVPDLYLADLVESNRKEVEKWVKKDPDAIDYTWQFKWVANLEKVSNYLLLEERTREAIKGVIPCNFLLPNPLHPEAMQFDIVTSSYCTDCINDRTEYFQAMKNIASLVRPGGYLVLISVLDGKHYKVGDFDFPASNVDPQTIKRALTDAGLQVVIFEEVYPEYDDTGLSKSTNGISGAVAKKL